MSTFGYIFVLAGIVMIRQVIVGRATDTPGDARDLFLAAINADMAGVQEVLSRRGESVSTGATGEVATGAPVDTGKYDLGAVQPHVKDAAYEIGPKFGIKSVLGWGPRPNKTDHDDGLALDFMTGSKTTGDALAAYVQENASRLQVTYIIWRQRIWNVGGSWKGMEDRGSPTANHMDHVHVSFRGA